MRVFFLISVLVAACNTNAIEPEPDAASGCESGSWAIEWACVERCGLPGSPYNLQDRFDVGDGAFRAWRSTWPDGGIRGFATCAGGSWAGQGEDGSSWTFYTDPLKGCVSWAGLPRPEPDLGQQNVWCFNEE